MKRERSDAGTRRQPPREQLAELRALMEIDRAVGLSPEQSARGEYLGACANARARYRTRRIARLQDELEALLAEVAEEDQRALARQPRLPLVYLVRAA